MELKYGLLVAAACLSLAPGLSVAAADETDDALVPMVVTLLSDPDKDVRALGLDQVRTAAKGEAATREFAAQLTKLASDGQVGLLSALADRGDFAARAAVLEMLAKSQNQDVRTAAIAALGPLGNSSDARLLSQLLGAGSASEQAAARSSLVRLSGDGVAAAITAIMKQAPAPLHVALIDVLAERRALDAVPTLLADALVADPAVRAAAMTALAQLAGPEHVAGMVEGVLHADAGREREAAERAVAAVCLRIAEAEQRADPLLAAFEALDVAERAALLSTMGRVGGSKSRQIIEAAIADRDPEQHERGLRALCNWPDASVAPRLIELVKTDGQAAHQAMALRALIRVAPLPDARPASEKLQLLEQAMSMCTRDEERMLALRRASAIRILETLDFVSPYLDQTAYAQQACETVVELAHHRALRESHKAEFDLALDKVVQTSADATVVDRAKRYKQGLTWVRPRAPAQPSKAVP